jgi:hypothetical protein
MNSIAKLKKGNSGWLCCNAASQKPVTTNAKLHTQKQKKSALPCHLLQLANMECQQHHVHLLFQKSFPSHEHSSPQPVCTINDESVEAVEYNKMYAQYIII